MSVIRFLRFALFGASLLASCSSPSTTQSVDKGAPEVQGAALTTSSIGTGQENSNLTITEIAELETTSLPFDDENPESCEIANQKKTYVGCLFWPTITYNPIDENFDFAVVLSNGGQDKVSVTVTGGALDAPLVAEVEPQALKVIKLPWVSALKGPTWANSNTSGGREYASTTTQDAAYRMETSLPVTAYQFNPLQYKKSKEGLAGCTTDFKQNDCFSVSNDASLLIPQSALTGNYRVPTWEGDENGDWGSAAGGFAITATQDETTVLLQYPEECDGTTAGVMGGSCTYGGEPQAQPAGGVETLSMNAGDVVQIMGDYAKWVAHADLSGTVVEADHPVQVIAFNPLTNIPDPTVGNPDHIEETVLPAQVLGKEYIVVAPTAPTGKVVGGHIIRLLGSDDETALTYEGDVPEGAPTTLSAGQVWESPIIEGAFKVSANAPFGVTSFMLGGGRQGGDACLSINDFSCSGDPAMSMVIAPAQFRKRYTFLAPVDYETNFADVLLPTGATATIDGQAVLAEATEVEGWQVARVPLSGTDGIHQLQADQPVGLQVMGFGHATSYYYPGGLNLKLISPPPPPIDIIR